jgi:hypothetical protein
MGSDPVESVLHGCVQMIHRIGTSSRVKGIGVSEERLATEGTYHIHHSGSIIRTDIGKVARLAEMYLDRGELAIEIDVSYACTSDKFLELGEKVVPRDCPEIGKEDF